MATTKITNPELFDLGSLNTALKLPSGTTAERPTSPSTGEWRYNTDNNLIEYYDGGSWRELQDEEIPPVPSEHFNTVLYDGTSATQSITGVGFQPDFVWIKRRDGAENHYWQDSSRGSTQQIYSNLTNAQFNETTAVTSFDSDGFTMGSYNGINNSGESYVAWCWKLNGGTTSSNTDGSITSTVQVNSKAGISIVQYTGTQSNATVGHGLGVAPSLVITKALGAANGWPTLVQAGTSRYDGLRLNEANLNNGGNGAGFFQNKTPTDSVFYLGNSDESNRNATATIAYCFAEVAGLSSIGGYSGNGSDNGPIINTGFEPAWLMIKVVTGSADGWFMVDNKRDTSNPRGIRVFANSDVGDASEAGAQVDFFSNGFQLRGSGAGQGQTNKSGSTYVYIAFASDASTAPVLADSFNVDIYTGDGTSNRVINTVGFRPDLYWLKTRDTSGCTYNNWFDTLRGGNKTIYSNASSAEVTNQGCGYIQSFDDNGVTYTGDASGINNSGEDFVYWAWKANPIPSINTDGSNTNVIVAANQAAGFSIIKYTGNGANGASVGHGLSATPTFWIIKQLTGTQVWVVGSDQLSASDNYLILNQSNAEQTNAPNIWSVDSTKITFDTSYAGTNDNNNLYIMYAFHSVSGYSKFGSYTGNGSSQSITTGFSPSWLMFKRTDQAGWNWEIADTARGVDVDLAANSSGAEQNQSPANRIQIDANGFTHLTANYHNISGASYIYVAFKENPTQYPLLGNMSFLVVAGGGSGAVYHGGGGGAGGLRTSYGSTSGGGASAENDITLAAGTYTITIGAGATGVTSSGSNVAGNNGSDSSIAASGLTTITSIGGGGGSSYAGQTTPGNGGSGGGGGNQSQAGGAGTAGQGNDGGTGSSSSTNYPSGGGGGAYAVGGNGSGTTAGNGGAGLSVEITGSSVAYAGGAGGSSFRGGTAGTGGTGGGANGTNADGTGNAGTTNTGGGGSGATAATSGAGGSGVVILRLATSEYSGTTTGSPTVTTDGDYTILKYTGSGTYVHS